MDDSAHRVRTTGVRIATAAAIGAAAGVTAAFFVRWQAAQLIGWDVAAALYVATIWVSIGRLDAEGTEAHAVREDPSIPAAELVMLTAAIACLGGVGLALFEAGHSHGETKGLLIALSILSVIASWGTVHSIFTLRYARLYYTRPPGGIDFNEKQPPAYPDFAYLSFTIGMTFQVSDTDLTTQVIRRTALRHALISYVFGVAIIGMTINIVASLLQ